MCDIRSFNCEDDLFRFFRKNVVSILGTGGEGACYRGYDNQAYKLFNPRISTFYCEYDPKNIVTKDDFDMESFAFPTELYVINNELRGYKSELIEGNLFSAENISNLASIRHINFDNLSKAYYNMAKDVIELSSNKVLIEDMPFNVIFDGERLTAIDTCDYRKVDYVPLEENIASLNCSLEMLFSVWFGDFKKIDYKIEDMDVDTYLDKIYNAIPEKLKSKKNIQYVKR